jgi:hypothetical protein
MPAWSIPGIPGPKEGGAGAATRGVNPTRLAVLGSAPKARRIRTCSTASRLHAARRGVIPVMASALLTIFFLSFRDKPSR